MGRMKDVAIDLAEYEAGALDAEETILLFADLIANGTVWKLQGSYGRTAKALIDRHIVSADGKVDWELFDDLTVS